MNMPVIEHKLYRKLFPGIPFSKMMIGLIPIPGAKEEVENKNYAFQITKEEMEKLESICKEWDINHSEYLRNSLWIAILKKLSTLSPDEFQKTVLDILSNETIE